MKSWHKHFNQDDYEKSDAPAKAIVKAIYITDNPIILDETPRDPKPDLQGDTTWYEVHHMWSWKTELPDYIFIPDRKAKLLKYSPLKYVVVSDNGSEVLEVPIEYLTKEYIIKVKSNKTIAGYEFFWKIPTSLCRRVK